MVLILATSLLVISLCVISHLESLRRITILCDWLNIKGRYRITISVLVAILSHTIHVWLFGLAYFFILSLEKANQIVSLDGPVSSFLDCVYFSFANYTSLGYGDLVPEGPIRFMAGTEALVGLVFIAWTASFLYLKMEQYWK
ncbi:two pore domain potassium channel family protein [Kangiella spongicola]|uniref:Two pore domain potassium channel family protein n=1 Tax=Kangiella spongicola TaxID=796379 RepID=A0A318D6V5_9GAMM|nr:two pore domain potassium channel family protein [Kangiella spongicola]